MDDWLEEHYLAVSTEKYSSLLFQAYNEQVTLQNEIIEINSMEISWEILGVWWQ